MVLEQNHSLSKKLHILYNWVDLEHHQSTNGIDFREKWNLSHPFVAVFAGVMGPSQYLELIIRVAESLQHREDLLFLLVGGGVEKDNLIQSTQEKQLSNVRFENFVSRDDYSELLKICSVGLVCLSPKNKTPVIPGKILGYMAAGLPVAAFLHQASDGHAVIKDSGCGLSADSADQESCVQGINQLLDSSEMSQMGMAGRAYAEKYYSKEICVNQMEALLK